MVESEGASMNTADMSFDEMDDFMEYKVKKSGRHRKSRQPKLRNGGPSRTFSSTRSLRRSGQ